MKLEKSDCLKLKYEALKWLRLNQRCPFIATEVGAYSADVIGINEKRIIEVEVKQSLSDLKADFRKMKHSNYLKNGWHSNWQTRWIPNAFYFAVSDDLVEPTKKLLKENEADRYGIISLSYFSVVKVARRLHDKEPHPHTKLICALRMGSELIKFHEAWL